MRLRLIIGLIVFVSFIMLASSSVLYYLVSNNLQDEAELRISNWTDELLVEIAKDPEQFVRRPERFIQHPNASEFMASNIIVQYASLDGKIIASSSNLKKSALPFSPGEDDLLKDVRFSDGTWFKIYQRKIVLEERPLGYILVGLPTSQIYASLDILRGVLVLVTFSAILILLFGISALASQQAIKEQKRFLSFASHELRTPLAVISGHAEVALRQQLSTDEYCETLNTIKEESDWMTRLVNNLLYVFRSQNKMKLNKTSFNLGILLTEEASATKKRYPDKKIVIDLAEEAEILADRDQIKKLVTNLLDNAAKYSGQNGEISIKLSSDRKAFFIEVTDNGKGIDPKLRNKIFDPFYRIEKGQEEGIGLGLAIAKWVVDAHRGAIRVESEPGRGSRFIVILPRK